VFLDRVPLLVVLIWPIVVDSAGELARAIAPRCAWLLGGAIVLADASLIEPIAVHAKLWTWTEPGLFAVPPIGILGWAFFAGAALAWLDARKRAVLVIAVAPVATHALLIATWWCALRWVNGPIGSWSAVIAMWGVLGVVAVSLRRAVPFAVLAMRLPGALFFFVLVALRGRDDAALVAWSLAFAMPYVAMLRLRADGLSRAAPATQAR
jgi:hypothetical protein